MGYGAVAPDTICRVPGLVQSLQIPFTQERCPRRESRQSTDLQSPGYQRYYGIVPLELAADIAGFGSRILQRRLAGKGLSYRELPEERRYEAAVELPGNSEPDISDITSQAGYTDPSHFSVPFSASPVSPPPVSRASSKLSCITGLIRSDAVNASNHERTLTLPWYGAPCY